MQISLTCDLVAMGTMKAESHYQVRYAKAVLIWMLTKTKHTKERARVV